MATQNEMHQESGNEKAEKDNQSTELQTSASSDLESREQRIEPFTDNDPYLPSRITETRSETEALLSGLSIKPVGFENVNRKQAKRLYEDAIERAGWSQARQDAFNGILRLGTSIPPRSKRVL
jgi:tRNA/tmRNA/rRNA uracil-C5-methylase (TrmA/RlmC/RlmD family)